jgi:hypothetical protein
VRTDDGCGRPAAASAAMTPACALAGIPSEHCAAPLDGHSPFNQAARRRRRAVLPA